MQIYISEYFNLDQSWTQTIQVWIQVVSMNNGVITNLYLTNPVKLIGLSNKTNNSI